MKAPIDDSVILITGASSGIGLELARQLAFRARALILVARRRDRLETLRDELVKSHPRLRVSVLDCDITDLPAVDRMLERAWSEHEFIDILVNNAGFGDIGLFEKASWPKLQSMIETNVIALTYLTRRLVEPMVQRRRGGILMVGSTAGLQWIPGFAAYCGTKHYVYGFTEALRVELKPMGISVSQLCPGPVATEFTQVASPKLENQVPAFAYISAEKCARIAIRGFSSGRAVIIPGVSTRFLMRLQGLTPRIGLRLLMSGVARAARRSLS